MATQTDRIQIVLVSPRNPLNIGAAARAMANFGFARLAVVAPYEPHWREALSAVGAETLLQAAQQTAHLQQAVADCTLVIGTGTLDYRRPQQPVLTLPELAPLVRRELDRGGRVALVFGPEKHGLTRDHLTHCHLLVHIPTSPRQPSMNLAQAVAVCLYELATRLPSTAAAQSGSAPPADETSAEASVAVTSVAVTSVAEPGADSAQLERLAQLIEETMAAAHYSPAEMRRANRDDLRLLLRRLALNQRDTRRILGLFRRILWRLRH